MADTIFALSTAPAVSGVAIVRISGAGAKEALALTETFKREGLPAPRQARLVALSHPTTDELIDKGLALWFPGPHSFTGEDTVEFHIHGSRAVIQELLEVLRRFPNFRMAEPGEFSRRAFLNGKMDLTQADGLADLIEAETSLQKRQALRQMEGELFTLYEGWRSGLIRMLALLEAYIDFPDEDIPEDVLEELKAGVAGLQEEIQAHLHDGHKGEKLKSGLQVVIVGAPNAGKSSLMNCLARRDVAITSPIAGTTRDTIEIQMDVGGYPIVLVDTAGLRESSDLIENEGIKRAKAKAVNADLVLALFDQDALPRMDKATYEMLGPDALVCISKIDKNPQSSNLELPEALASHKPVRLSTETGEGIDALLKALEEKAKTYLGVGASPLITRARYREALGHCMESLERFSFDIPLELAAEDLRMAGRSLGRITGRIDVEDILDSLFQQFCIGK
ncbi:MAG: mnmE [Rickettsiales bacterium]|jgi:tRNA modification GTPase|nr:mnmE [Rickettsiales bacterium]